MTLITYKPRTQLAGSFDNWIDNFFNFDTNIDSANYNINPEFDIQENEESYLISADMPGVNKKDIDLSISNDTITISGERKSNDGKKSSTSSSYCDTKYGAFSKSLYLPDDANIDKISAKMKDGVLSITINKLDKIPADIKKISIK